MKILLLFSSHGFSVYKAFSVGLKSNNIDFKLLDPNSLFHENYKQFRKIIKNIHGSFAEHFENIKYNRINKRIIEEFEEYKPDVVISYNDSSLYTSTISIIKEKAKFVTLLADNPFYSFFKKKFLEITLSSDAVILFDSKCMEQLKMFGFRNIIFHQLGFDPTIFYKQKNLNNKIDYEFEILYVGSIHNLDSWAYKRAFFLNQFVDRNFAVFGNKTWLKVLPKFPMLNNHFILLDKSMSFIELNEKMNKSRIYPIDAHPGIINGIHARVFDAMGSGILPLVEYREDIKLFFNDVFLPTFQTYEEAKRKAVYYLNHGQEAERIATELHQFGINNYTSQICVKKIVERILE